MSTQGPRARSLHLTKVGAREKFHQLWPNLRNIEPVKDASFTVYTVQRRERGSLLDRSILTNGIIGEFSTVAFANFCCCGVFHCGYDTSCNPHVDFCSNEAKYLDVARNDASHVSIELSCVFTPPVHDNAQLTWNVARNRFNSLKLLRLGHSSQLMPLTIEISQNPPLVTFCLHAKNLIAQFMLT